MVAPLVRRSGGGNFTPGEFTPVNITNYGRRNIRKHREIKDGKKYITLDISLKVESLDKMKTTSPDPKGCLRRSRKGLITFLGLKTIGRFKKKATYGITSVIMKYLSKYIRDI